MKVRLGDHLDFSNGTSSPPRTSDGRFRVYGANGAIGYAAQHNATGPLIVLGRVGSYCGSLRYCDSDVWVTDNALVCRAKDPRETRYWYYALHTCGLNEHRAGSGQPLLNQRILRDVSVSDRRGAERRPIAELLGAVDDKIAANERVIAAAESLMVASAESVTDYVPLSEPGRPVDGIPQPARVRRRGRPLQPSGVRRRRETPARRRRVREERQVRPVGAVRVVREAESREFRESGTWRACHRRWHWPARSSSC